MKNKRRKSLIMVLSAIVLVMTMGAAPTYAKTVKAGVPFTIKETSDVYVVGQYECWVCSSIFDEPNVAWDPEWNEFVYSCPYCGAEDCYGRADYAGQTVGTFLERVYLYRENPKKDPDAPFLRELSCDYNTYNFCGNIKIKKPGKYYLEYDYETYDPYNEDDSWKEYRTLHVLGQVVFNPNRGSVAPAKSSKWIKQKTKVGKLPKATRKGYKFKGWYTKKKGGKKINKKTIVKFTKAKRTYYAHWKKK